MSEELKYAEFQNALIELLASGLPEDAILATLKSDSRFEDYRDYVEQFDPDMGQSLVNWWASGLGTKWINGEEACVSLWQCPTSIVKICPAFDWL